MPTPLFGAVEGALDEAVLVQLSRYAGFEVGPIHGKRGKAYVREKLRGYNQSAARFPWFVLIDLDEDDDCAPPFLEAILPVRNQFMCLRIAVHEIEAWLLADRERFASFFSVGMGRLPPAPEEVVNPKELIVDLMRRSRKRALREDMVPRPGSGRPIGPAYDSRLREFVETDWRPRIAAQRSPSLQRAMDCLKQLAARYQTN